MRKISVLIFMLAALLISGVLVATAQEEKAESEFEYVGPKKCKMCHKDIYEAWEKTGHAETFGVLTEEEQKKDECITCHITGYDDEGELIANVTCEACHGPGSEYKSPKIMSRKWEDDPETYKAKAMEAGLVYPTAENCKTCHKKEGNPNFKPFDWEKMSPKVHPVAEEE